MIRGDNGAKVWTFNDANNRTNGTDSPAVGDVNYDGDLEIYATAATTNILAFRRSASWAVEVRPVRRHQDQPRHRDRQHGR